MIDMQMGAEHEVDRGGINAGPPQPVEEAASAPLMPGRDLGTILAFADAAVDEDRSSSRSKQKALDRESRLVAVADKKLGLQDSPLRLDHVRIESRQELREWKTKIVVIHDDVDDRISDRKAHDGLPLQCPDEGRASRRWTRHAATPVVTVIGVNAAES